MLSRRLRPAILIGLACIIAAVCVRLGIWQLHRLSERRAHNAIIAARLAESPVSISQLPRDSAALHYRHVQVRGTYDPSHEIVLTSRTRNGSPGVNIITPVRIAQSDTLVLVNRGWIYAPDGVSANLTPWREDTVNAIGYAEPFGSPRPGESRSPTRPSAYRWLDRKIVQQAFPYPVYPFLVVLQGDSTSRPGIPPHIPQPSLDEGPHLSYAIQWFAFALIAIIGSLFFIRANRAE